MRLTMNPKTIILGLMATVLASAGWAQTLPDVQLKDTEGNTISTASLVHSACARCQPGPVKRVARRRPNLAVLKTFPAFPNTR